jgi:hypothetical protein
MPYSIQPSGRAISLRVFPAIGLFLLLSLAGCKDDATIWKTEVRSPAGAWAAVAETVQNGGFGSGSIDTQVYLRKTKDAGSQEVLGFLCDGPPAKPYVLDDANAGGTIDLKMTWVTPSHLLVTYDHHPNLYFEVVKYGGIDITAEEIPASPAVRAPRN